MKIVSFILTIFSCEYHFLDVEVNFKLSEKPCLKSASLGAAELLLGPVLSGSKSHVLCASKPVPSFAEEEETKIQVGSHLRTADAFCLWPCVSSRFPLANTLVQPVFPVPAAALLTEVPASLPHCCLMPLGSQLGIYWGRCHCEASF